MNSYIQQDGAWVHSLNSIFRHPTTKATDIYSSFRPIKYHGTLVAWECQLNRGYVENAIRYEVNYSSTPGGFFKVKKNRVYVASYSEFAHVTLGCKAFLDDNTSAEVVEQHIYADSSFDPGNYLTCNNHSGIFALIALLTSSTLIYVSTAFYLLKYSGRPYDNDLSRTSSKHTIRIVDLLSDDNGDDDEPVIVHIDRDQLGRHYFAYLIKLVAKYDYLQRMLVRLEPKQRQSLWEIDNSYREVDPQYVCRRQPSDPTDTSGSMREDAETGGLVEGIGGVAQDKHDSEVTPSGSLHVDNDQSTETVWLQPVVIQPKSDAPL